MQDDSISFLFHCHPIHQARFPVHSNDKESILSPETLIRIKDLALMSRLAVEGYLTGRHKSLSKGYGGEFLQYRSYTPGDDPKYLDWKLFARQDTYQMKVFQEETQMKTAILLDASASMDYKGTQAPCTKFRYGQCIAACLAYLALKQGDQVAIITYADSVLSMASSTQANQSLSSMLAQLEQIKPNGTADHEKAWNYAQNFLKGRGMAILISDFHECENSLPKLLRTIRFGQRDTIVMQTLDQDEIKLPFLNSLKFIDSETNAEIPTEPTLIAEFFQEKVRDFIDAIKSECLTNQTDYLLANTSDNLAGALNAFLNRRQPAG